MKKLITLSAIIAACTMAAPAMARGGDRVDERQDRQQHRIEQGYRSGDLTRHEARRLERGQDKIDRMQRDARRDGHVDRRERSRIRDEVARQDRRIHQERHDGDRWRGYRYSRNDGWDRGYDRDRGYHKGHDHAPARGYRDRDRDHHHSGRVIIDPFARLSLIFNLP